ncbi:MAG TPA: GGDEF domain-containing protein [Ramlibacter sp.]|nr:GGDEF domain-containing protein [Ramlibacter sp.]
MRSDFEPTAAFDPTSGGAAPAPALPDAWISYTMRRLEPWVAWAIAVYTAWLAVVAFPHLPAVWLFCLYAGLVGKWAEVHPPRHQGEMALRGAALVAGAYVLHTYAAPQTGGPGGAFFFWLSITCLYYAFMLKPAWGAGVVALAILEFAVASVQLRPEAALAELAVSGGFLAIFPLLLAVKFGAMMRQPDEALEEGRIDGSTHLFNKAGLLAHGEDLLAACRRERRPLSLAVFDCADLLEVRKIYGSRLSRQLMARTARKFAAVAGDRGIAARTGPAQFTVVFPGLTRDKALQAIQRVLGHPPRIEFDAGHSEIVLVPEYAVDTAGESASVQDMHRSLCASLAQASEWEQRRRDYLQRERESHSRPMGLHSLPPAGSAPSQPALHAAGPGAATLPVPLTAA